MNIMEGLKHVISKTQENCKIGNYSVYSYGPNDLIGVYVHTSSTPNAGLKASYIVLSSKNKVDQSLKPFAEKLAMQVVAFNPKFLSKETVPVERLADEKKIFADAVLAEGKKPELLDKIVASRINGWYEETVLNEQQFLIVDHDEEAGKIKVSQVVQKKGKELGLDDLYVKDFKLFI
jgi:elongation factor Ts